MGAGRIVVLDITLSPLSTSPSFLTEFDVLSSRLVVIYLLLSLYSAWSPGLVYCPLSTLEIVSYANILNVNLHPKLPYSEPCFECAGVQQVKTGGTWEKGVKRGAQLVTLLSLLFPLLSLCLLSC